MNLEEFKKKNKKLKNKSKLFDFKNEIIELITDGYSQESICEFLKENGVNAKQSNLSQFIKKLTKAKKEIPKIEEEKIEKAEVEELQEPQEPTQKKSLLKTSNVKKFEIIEPDYSKFQ